MVTRCARTRRVRVDVVDEVLRTNPVLLAQHLYAAHGQDSLALVDLLESVDDNFRARLRAELQDLRRRERSEPKS